MSFAESTRCMESPTGKAGASTSGKRSRCSQSYPTVVREPLKSDQNDCEQQHVKPQLSTEPVVSPRCRRVSFQDRPIDIREIGIHQIDGNMKAGISLDCRVEARVIHRENGFAQLFFRRNDCPVS